MLSVIVLNVMVPLLHLYLVLKKFLLQGLRILLSGMTAAPQRFD